MTAGYNTNIPTELIDALGKVRAQQAALEAKEAEIKKSLLELPAGTYEGEDYVLTVLMPETKRPDWKAIAEKVGYSNQLLVANTKTSVSRTLRTAARQKLEEVD